MISFLEIKLNILLWVCETICTDNITIKAYFKNLAIKITILFIKKLLNNLFEKVNLKYLKIKFIIFFQVIYFLGTSILSIIAIPNSRPFFPFPSQ